MYAQTFELSDALKAAIDRWKDARSDAHVLKIVFKAEVLVEAPAPQKADSSVPASSLSGVEATFQSLQPLVQEKEACILLVKLATLSNTPERVLVAWVPEGVSAKEKVMYATGRAILGRYLGTGTATGKQAVLEEFFCSTKSELSYEGYRSSRKGGSGRPASAQEAASADSRVDRKVERSEDASRPKHAVMPSIPITPKESLKDHLKNFKNGRENCLQISVDDKSSTVDANPSPYQGASILSANLESSKARYYLLRGRDRVVLILSCPDGASPTQKLFYAACKNRIVDIVREAGIHIWKSLDVRSPNDLKEDTLWDDGGPAAGTIAAASLIFNKPSPPGTIKSADPMNPSLGGLAVPSSGGAGAARHSSRISTIAQSGLGRAAAVLGGLGEGVQSTAKSKKNAAAIVAEASGEITF
ncbi:unnamed protein product [Vitrella brassicaformis CCMP3155]|uniref:ADF-H domain-containing protein n=2 Tax=Vitrella brassicaformis TaxID=1169539 RepID=A0A0G4FRD1_VITBC|nr:unnamed protein product [Vitrella brassicaformis CCMP3155]|eukprot:CEM16612.1 unnamed protein product [Vitrella brassicaformis CCMP3155]